MATAKSISAQVIIKPPTTVAEPVTAANVHQLIPAPDVVTAIKKAFAKKGFEVGNVVANSFSITAPISTFEKMFGVRFAPDERGGMVVRGARDEPRELPKTRLPKALARDIAAITFGEPPDFGPTNF